MYLCRFNWIIMVFIYLKKVKKNNLFLIKIDLLKPHLESHFQQMISMNYYLKSPFDLFSNFIKELKKTDIEYKIIEICYLNSTKNLT